MADWFYAQNLIVQAVLATTGTWLSTAVGAAAVLFFVSVSRRVLDGMLGFAAGVMVAASSWSLLIPAIESAGSVWPAVLGLLAGAVFILAADKLLPHRHPEDDKAPVEGPRVNWRRTFLLVFAITIHNFPEGMAVGVSFGSGESGPATALAIGIGLQNIPEGLAVALPLRREGLSRGEALFWGQASALVEPLGGLFGAALVSLAVPLLPYGLAFAAGAMLYVVVEELIPATAREEHTDIATVGFLVGFTVMMALDNLFG
ncbi:MAG: ZIP family metal transporter [Phycisphaerae bacterium]